MQEVPAESLAATAVTLARRFAGGATMWCVAPDWPAHGKHVAVEFVHPVIVGKRALPAIHVDEADMAGSLRMLVRPGDVLLVVGPVSEAVKRLLLRAEAWGLESIWLGAGPRPHPTAAGHIVWSDDPDPHHAAYSGGIVLLYHLLWELTHVVFEHPGLTAEIPECQGPVCITCSDQGRVGEISRVGDRSRAEVLVGGVREQVDITLLGPVSVGDLVLVHAGTALSQLENLP
jgi:hydrogenase maturation factor